MKNIKAAILGAFVADTFSLGAHWVYDTRIIAKEFANVDELRDPLPGSYHPNRKKGEFTHYGDQAMWLLESLSAQKSFNAEKYNKLWQDRMETYDGYVDGASKGTLSNLKAGKEPNSENSDFSAVGRITPLLFLNESKEDFIKGAKTLVSFTHDSAEVKEVTAFVAEWLYEVLNGEKPSVALSKLVSELKVDSSVKQMVEKALQTSDKKTGTGVKRLGQACNVDGAFPAAVYILLKHEDSYKTAMTENILAGGDSSARGMIIGAILVAYHGIEAIPAHWLSDMKAKSEIADFLSA